MKLIKFSAAWCQPCKQLSNTLETINHPIKSTIIEYDIDQNLEITKKFHVRSVPTMIILDEIGHEIKRLTGNHSKEKILDFLKV